MSPNGQRGLKEQTHDVDHNLFGQMWISHSQSVKYSLMVRNLRHPGGRVQVLGLDAHSGECKQGHNEAPATFKEKRVSRLLQQAQVKDLNQISHLERVMGPNRVLNVGQGRLHVFERESAL